MLGSIIMPGFYDIWLGGWDSASGKVKMKNVFLCMALEIEPRLFYFSKSQSLKCETHDSFLLCI